MATRRLQNASELKLVIAIVQKLELLNNLNNLAKARWKINPSITSCNIAPYILFPYVPAGYKINVIFREFIVGL